jgi:hypothetical protein
VPSGVSDVLDYVLVEHQLVRHRQERVETHVDLGLPAGSHFVVLHFDLDAESLQREDHLRTQILEMVGRWDGEVALLVTGLVTEVRPLVTAGVPRPLDRIDLVERRTLIAAVADLVKDEELSLRPEVDSVGDARCL